MPLKQSLQAIERRVDNTASLTSQEKQELKEEINDAQEELKAYEKDVWVYRIVVSVLGLAILFIIVAITILLNNKITGFDALTAIGSAAVGGLVGLLAPSPASRS